MWKRGSSGAQQEGYILRACGEVIGHIQVIIHQRNSFEMDNA